jgi:hypothetical protein
MRAAGCRRRSRVNARGGGGGGGPDERCPAVRAHDAVEGDLDRSGVGAQTDLEQLERRLLGRPDQVGGFVAGLAGGETEDVLGFACGEEVGHEAVRERLDDLDVDAQRTRRRAAGWPHQADRPSGAIAQ